MKDNIKRKITIMNIGIIILFIMLLYLCLEAKTECYTLYLNTDLKVHATGIMTKSLFQNTIYLNVDFNNPEVYKTVGIFVLENDTLNLLEASSGGAYVTDEGYKVTNKTFDGIEKRNRNGNIINRILKNKDNTYLCLSKSTNQEDIAIDDCTKIEIGKSK